MKINELKRIAEENDYEFSKVLGDFHFKKRYRTNFINISGYFENRIWISGPHVCDDEDFNMIKASVKFAETPIEEREDEKKYYLRHRWFGYGKCLHLMKNNENNTYGLCDINIWAGCTDKFTREEIDEIKEKHNTDLSDYELVEVQE